MAQHPEQLPLQQSQPLTDTVSSIVGNITACRCKERFNRSYERQSEQPYNKWQRNKKKEKGSDCADLVKNSGIFSQGKCAPLSERRNFLK